MLSLLRATAVIATTLAIAALGACSNTGPDCGTGGDSCTPPPEETRHNAADEQFVIGALQDLGWQRQIADLAADRSDDPQVLDVAEDVLDELAEHTDKVHELAEAWELFSTEPVIQGKTALMVPDGDFADLLELSGPKFDELWVSVMLQYNHDIIIAADAVIEDGLHDHLESVATELRDVQTDWTADLNELP